MRTASITLALLTLAIAEVAAQDAPIAACQKGTSTFPPLVAERVPRAPALLARLAWRGAFKDYVAVATRTSYAAALDTIAARADSLFASVGSGVSEATRQAYRARLRRARTDIAHWEVTHDAEELANWEIGDLRPALLIDLPMTVRAFIDSSTGSRLMLNFARDSLAGAIAVCVAAMTAYQYLEFLRADEVKRVATLYADLAHRWDLFIKDGYSMTLWERLAHSCRLGPLDYVIATFTAPGCGKRDRFALGPPVVQSLFVHPGAGFAPVFDSTGAYRSIALVEWWGGLYHIYRNDRILTFGVSVASAFSDHGESKMRIGGVLHTPIGAVGYFESRGGVEGRRGRVTVSADVLGWLPHARSALASVSSGRLGRTLVTLAKEQLTGAP